MADVVDGVLYRVDWAAVSTVVLTIITGYYAWSTRQMLKATARQAAAAERTVDLLSGEQRRRLEQCRAPIQNGIKQGQSMVLQWLATDFQAWREPNSWPDSRELELGELAELIAQSRVLWFPLSQLLSRVDDQIVKARYAIDEAATAPDEEAFIECARVAREELLRLSDLWAEADREVTSWQ